MPPDPKPTVADINGIFYRFSSYDTPFWARENSRSGRWHARGEGPVQYLSRSAHGAWAELIRAEELETEEQVAMVSMSMWAVEVSCHLIVDYSTFEKAEAAGLNPEALVDDDYAMCQREGARLRELNYAGVLAPSAALPGEINLTLCGPRIASTWGRSPVLRSSLPAIVIAQGAPPPGLLARVRPLGVPHSGLADFVAERSSKRRGGV